MLFKIIEGINPTAIFILVYATYANLYYNVSTKLSKRVPLLPSFGSRPRNPRPRRQMPYLTATHVLS